MSGKEDEGNVLDNGRSLAVVSCELFLTKLQHCVLLGTTRVVQDDMRHLIGNSSQYQLRHHAHLPLSAEHVVAVFVDSQRLCTAPMRRHDKLRTYRPLAGHL